MPCGSYKGKIKTGALLMLEDYNPSVKGYALDAEFVVWLPLATTEILIRCRSHHPLHRGGFGNADCFTFYDMDRMTQKTIYALGVFDGVHAGHGALLRCCRALAEASHMAAGVVTFAAHPDMLVHGQAPRLINTIADRECLLKGLFSMDTVVTLPFDKALRDTPWQDFFARLLTEYQAGGLVCGHDFRFGARGEGSAVLLQGACAQAGIPCQVVPQQKIDGIPISSTYIRQLLEQGDMERACHFLGHPHIFTGTVTPGQKLGRTIGIPTANLHPSGALVQLRHGVYACRAFVDGREHLAVTNVGTRPTVNGKSLTIESWLPDFAGELYGKRLTLAFYAYLRPEKKFPCLGDLQAEIQKNAAQVREFFGKT